MSRERPRRIDQRHDPPPALGVGDLEPAAEELLEPLHRQPVTRNRTLGPYKQGGVGSPDDVQIGYDGLDPKPLSSDAATVYPTPIVARR